VKALILQHEQPTPGGLVLEWLDEIGAEVEVHRIDLQDREIEPREHDMIVSLGSEFAAFDDSIPWIPREAEVLRRASRQDVPVLGICFGGQLLAHTLGGRCWRAEESEIGWLPVRSSDPALVPEGPWFQWHFDTFTPPPGAKLVADSPAGPQAFTVGRSLGTQFHPEVTPEIIDEWVRVYRHELEPDGVDPDALVEETHALWKHTRASARQLLNGWFERVARLRPEAGIGG
jgi:GMP synthase-like glutamine amidotransferase